MVEGDARAPGVGVRRRSGSLIRSCVLRPWLAALGAQLLPDALGFFESVFQDDDAAGGADLALPRGASPAAIAHARDVARTFANGSPAAAAGTAETLALVVSGLATNAQRRMPRPLACGTGR